MIPAVNYRLAPCALSSSSAISLANPLPFTVNIPSLALASLHPPRLLILQLTQFCSTVADALASYLYLIRPPPGAKHKPVDPAKLTLAGDSAGGGLCLALLCLIRDAGLPAPAGGEHSNAPSKVESS